MDGCFDVPGAFFDGISFCGHIGSGGPGRREDRFFSIVFKVFLAIAVVMALGFGGFAIYQHYDPQTQSQIMCDEIVSNMASRDPYEESEEPGPYVLENDRWGNSIIYVRTVDDDKISHMVRSHGADGVPNTVDDIVCEIEKPYIAKAIGKALGKGIKDLGKGLWNGIWE